MLTKAQHKILSFLQQFFQQQGYAPTTGEIAQGIGIKSRGVIHRNLQAIMHEGLIKMIPGKHRNIQLIEQHAGCLPLVGAIAAGKPIEAIENVEWLNLTERLFGGNRYLLKVKGNSMIEENICDGDIVICQHSASANNGEIVVALVDDQEATLKRFKRNQNNNTVSLIPANIELQTQVYKADRVKIQGLFVGLLRLVA